MQPYQTRGSSLLKPSFIIFNVSAYTAYILAVLSFLFKSDTLRATDGAISGYYQAVFAINGSCFLVLTCLLLNFGKRLERVVKAIKVKTEVIQQRKANEMASCRNVDDERQQVSQSHQAQTLAKNQQILKALNFRIFIVTAFMSLLLAAIAVVELICSFGYIKRISDIKQYKLAIFFTVSEAIPSTLIACYLRKSIVSDDNAQVDHYKAV